MLKHLIKTKRILFISISILFFTLFFVLFILPESYEDWMIYLVSYENIRDNFKYDHIEYDGTSYYYLKTDYSVPSEFIPFDSERVYINIVDNDGDAYDENRKEEARIYVNDKERLFIYFQSAPFTKNKRYAAEFYGFDD